MAAKKVEGARLGVSAKRTLITPGDNAPSLRRQCELLGVNRAGGYAQGAPATEREENLRLMRRMGLGSIAPNPTPVARTRSTRSIRICCAV